MKYKTLNPVRHNGKLHPENKTLELKKEEAEPLLECNAIEPLQKAGAADKPDDKKDG